jgi:poly(hydroxyalkanoate) granule-associated protein
MATNEKKIRDDLRASAHRIWLAGLGAFAAAEEEGEKLFDRLVDRGRGVEMRGGKRSKISSQVLAEILDRIPEVGKRVSEPQEGRSAHLLRSQSKDQDMETIATEIDRLYARIREVVASDASPSEVTRAIRPLRKELRRLQTIQADTMESYFLSQLRFDPAAGQELVERAEGLLKKR